MPLVFAPANTQLKILRVSAGEKIKKHLESLGVVGGGTIVVLTAESGSVVCKIGNGRIALDKNISAKIFVCVAK